MCEVFRHNREVCTLMIVPRLSVGKSCFFLNACCAYKTFTFNPPIFYVWDDFPRYGTQFKIRC